jgi:hypothetical protein
MNTEINILTVFEKDLKIASERNCPFSNLKKVYKLTAFLQTLQRLKQEWQKSPASDQANRRQKLDLVWGNRKKISQIINAYLYIPGFLLIILCLSCTPLRFS